MNGRTEITLVKSMALRGGKTLCVRTSGKQDRGDWKGHCVISSFAASRGSAHSHRHGSLHGQTARSPAEKPRVWVTQHVWFARGNCRPESCLRLSDSSVPWWNIAQVPARAPVCIYVCVFVCVELRAGSLGLWLRDLQIPQTSPFFWRSYLSLPFLEGFSLSWRRGGTDGSSPH